MPKKNKSKTTTNQTTTLQYEPTQGMPGYLDSTAYLRNLVKNPFMDPAFLLERGMINQQALGLGQRNVSTFMNNMINSGFGSYNMPGFQLSGLNKINRGTASLQAQGLLAAMLQATQRQFAAGQTLQRPLQTGQTTKGTSTTTQSQSGGFLGPLMSIGGTILSPFTAGFGGAAGLGLGGGGFGSVPMTMGGGFGGPWLGMAGTNAFNSGYWQQPTSPTAGYSTPGGGLLFSPYGQPTGSSPYNPFTYNPYGGR